MFEKTLDTMYRYMRAAILIVTIIPFIILVVNCRTYDEFIEELLG